MNTEPKRRKKGNPGIKGKLISKSLDAYVHSLETVNCISKQYRVEAFCFLLCNAWELLLKAVIIHQTNKPKDIYYPRRAGESLRSLSLRDCLKRIFASERDPVRLNIERLADLRDAATHLFIKEVPRDILGLLQSSVINYHRLLTAVFDLSLSSRVPVGMMAIVYDLPPEEPNAMYKRLARVSSRCSADFLRQFSRRLNNEYNSLHSCPDYMIGIEYSLRFTKQEGEADVSLSQGPVGRGVITPMNVPKDPSVTHPFTCATLAEELTAKLGFTVKTNVIVDINRAFDVSRRNEWFYQGKVRNSPKQYSRAYMEWISKNYEKDKEFFNKARRRARAKDKK